jgi:hypothetical protein
MTMDVPKNLIKRLVGYRNGTLEALKRRLRVKFDYDSKWWTDMVYNMDDMMSIYIYGKGTDVLEACSCLQVDLEALGMTTITVPKEEVKFYLDNIKKVKTWCDPCEVRVKKFFPPTKDKGDIKHSFFYLPITTGEICLIGNKEEIDLSHKKIKEFLEYHKDAPNVARTSCCFLLPSILKQYIREIKDIIVKSAHGLIF